MGLFDFMKKKPEPKVSSEQEIMAILDKVDPEFRQRRANLDYQNDLLSRVNAARAFCNVNPTTSKCIYGFFVSAGLR